MEAEGETDDKANAPILPDSFPTSMVLPFLPYTSRKQSLGMGLLWLENFHQHAEHYAGEQKNDAIGKIVTGP